jgi:hypothetical protein
MAQDAPADFNQQFLMLFTQFITNQGNLNQQMVAAQATGPSLNINLPPFHGKAGENVSTWIFQVGEIFDARGILHARRLHYIAGCLKDAALHWYQNQCARTTPNAPYADLQAFITAIKDAFQPPHFQQVLRRQLKALKQAKDVQEYVFNFRNLIGQIEGMGKLDQVSHFIDGLKHATQVEVNYRAPEAIKDAIKIAVTYDTARFGLGRVQPTSSYSNSATSRPSYPNRDNGGYRPIELDAVERTGPGARRLPGRLTPEQRDNLRREGRCFYCRETGHVANVCPAKTNRP